MAVGDPGTWTSLWERGGMALVLIACIFVLARATVPWIKEYLEGLEKRNAETQVRWEQRMDASQDKFLAELREERNTRERTEDAFREMLHAHKAETVAAIHEQTRFFAELLDELRSRPCQKPHQ